MSWILVRRRGAGHGTMRVIMHRNETHPIVDEPHSVFAARPKHVRALRARVNRWNNGSRGQLDPAAPITP